MAQKTPKRKNLPHADRYGAMERLSREFGLSGQDSEPEPAAQVESSTADTSDTLVAPRIAKSVMLFREAKFFSLLVQTSAELIQRSGQPMGGVRHRRAVYATPDELAQFDPDVLRDVVATYDAQRMAAPRAMARLTMRGLVTAHMPSEHSYAGAEDRVVLVARVPLGDSMQERRLREERTRLRVGLLGLPDMVEPWEVHVGCSTERPTQAYLEAVQEMFPREATGVMDMEVTHIGSPNSGSLAAKLWVPTPPRG